MVFTALIVFLLYTQNDAPFKAKEDFEIKFDLSFKQRTHSADNKTVHLNETRAEHEKRTSATPLPYLKLMVKIIRVPAEEVKLKVIKDDANTVLSKKVESGMEFKLDLGFTDDIKDKISGYKHVIQFLSSDKRILSRILIEFDNEGNYFVNGEKRGKV
jgi:hypothetical protein